MLNSTSAVSINVQRFRVEQLQRNSRLLAELTNSSELYDTGVNRITYQLV